MSLHKYMERFRYIDSLVRKKATGTPLSLSKKLHLSKSGTCKLIREMKEEGFPISYCRKGKSYIYLEEGKMPPYLFELENNKVEMIPM